MLCRVALRIMRLLLRLRLLHVVDVYLTTYHVQELETSLHLVGRRQRLHVKVTGRSRIFGSDLPRRQQQPLLTAAFNELSRPGTLHIAFEMQTHSRR